MVLKTKKGRYQEGLCFVSAEGIHLEPGIYEIRCNDNHLLTEVRPSKRVPSGLIVLDERIYNELECTMDSEVSLNPVHETIPICSNLSLSVSSKRAIDIQLVADTISKRVNDLREDFNGLILKNGQVLSIERLGLQFKVLSLAPKNDVYSASRISWDVLEEIYLEPQKTLNRFNLCCVVEIGAASQISDIDDDSKNNAHSHIPRYEAALSAINEISKNYADYNTDSQFCGFAYCDEIFQYPIYDSETGESIVFSSIHSPSLLLSFIEWIRKTMVLHKGKPSNPGNALLTAIEAVSTFRAVNNYPTVLFFCSSGFHTAGPNPVKVVKTHFDDPKLAVFSLSLGKESNFELMEAIVEYSKGRALKVTDSNQIETVPLLLTDILNHIGDS